jgi:endonuclease/exonuclease/phosphatase (EEP) superfamily protein YafD
MWRRICIAIAVALALTVPLGRLSGSIDAFTSFLPLAPILAFAALVPLGSRAGPVTIALALGIFAIVAVVLVPELGERASPGATAASGMRLILITQNVAVANSDPRGTIDALLASDADIVMLQESDGSVAPYHRRLEARYPYHNRCPIRCSLALYSRFPMTAAHYRARAGDGTPFGPPLLWATVRLPDGFAFPIATYHEPWPLPAARQAAWRRALPGALASFGTGGLVLGGDFNLTPWSSAMAHLDRAVAPLHRITHAAFSFPAKLVGRPWPVPLLPIDQVYAGPDWAVEEVDVLPANGSDHYAIRAELRLSR